MATYVLPQVLVFQDFQTSPAAVANPLRSHISGPHAFAIRFDDNDEKDDGKLGFYDHVIDTGFEWPNRPAGGDVDEPSVSLFVENGLLQYFDDPVSGGSAITKSAGSKNRVRSDTVNFAENGGFARDASLLDRDVQLGDIVKARFVPGGGDPVTVYTFVNGLIGDTVAAVVAAGSSDIDNALTQGASTSVVMTGGPENCVTLTPDGTLYDGLAEGDITEVYSILVLEGSISGDLTTAKVRVVSASGNDDQAEVVPSAATLPTPIGTRGLNVVFADDDLAACSASADVDGVTPNDLISGQSWDVTVSQAFTKPTPTSGGGYTGQQDTTYILEVTRGGLYTGTDKPQIQVSTTNGIDVSGPTDITAAAVAVAVGTKSTTVAFDGTGLRKGDRYFIAVTAETEGAIKTIVFGNNIPDEVPDGTECDLTLYILKPTAEIPQNRIQSPPLLNWETSDTEITVNSSIELFDPTWTDSGVQVPLPLRSESSQDQGRLFVEYRAFLQDLCNEVGTINDVANLNDQISGPLDPINPLKWGVFKALSNSNGVDVKYTAVCDPDSDESWADVLELLQGRDDVYGLVALTKRRTVADLYAAHVDANSTPEEGLWRVTWFSLTGVPTKDILNETLSSDGEVIQATIKDDPDTSGTQFTIVEVPGNNAQFLTNEVRPGDILRTLYTSDGFGNETFSEFVVDVILTEDSLRLLSGPGAAINVAAKIEVIRNLSSTEEAREIALDAGAFNNRRVRATWPDTIETAGIVQEGYHLNAALAGLRSGVLPHQGMTNLEVAGFTDVPRTTSKFNKPQLDILAAAGTWIVTQDIFDGEIFSRHAVTTGDTEDIAQREEMITSNVDSISYRFKDHFAPFIGVSNVTPSMIELLGLEGKSLIEVLKTESFTQQLGGQLIDAEIIELRAHTILKDRVLMVIDTDIPVPLNNLETRLQIVL